MTVRSTAINVVFFQFFPLASPVQCSSPGLKAWLHAMKRASARDWAVILLNVTGLGKGHLSGRRPCFRSGDPNALVRKCNRRKVMFSLRFCLDLLPLSKLDTNNFFCTTYKSLWNSILFIKTHTGFSEIVLNTFIHLQKHVFYWTAVVKLQLSTCTYLKNHTL